MDSPSSAPSPISLIVPRLRQTSKILCHVIPISTVWSVLFEYNPPLILEVLEQANKLGQVKVVAFDENDRTLKGIQDDQVQGTIAQDPYMYGYKSMEYLAKLHKGENPAKLAFVTNGVAPFWDIAAKGALQAKADFSVEVDVVMPSGGITDQKDKIEDLVTRKVDGIAVSPIDAKNQTGLLNRSGC